MDREDDPDWLFRQCHRIVKALADQSLALAQIYALNIPVVELDALQLQKLAIAAPLTRANFNPDQPRDAGGRWTDQGNPGAGTPSAGAPRGMWREPNDLRIKPGRPDTSPTQLVADNQRENKMVTDIVVQLRLSKDQRQTLHRAISGQGLTYRQILDLAKDMFNK